LWVIIQVLVAEDVGRPSIPAGESERVSLLHCIALHCKCLQCNASACAFALRSLALLALSCIALQVFALALSRSRQAPETLFACATRRLGEPAAHHWRARGKGHLQRSANADMVEILSLQAGAGNFICVRYTKTWQASSAPLESARKGLSTALSKC